MEVSLGPGHIVLDGDPAPLSHKGDRAPPIFGLFLLSANGWMHQDATWYGDRPRPRRLCIRWGPSYPQNSGHTHHHPVFGPCFFGQTAVWMKTSLGTEVDLGPGHIVLEGAQLCAKRAQQPPIFSAHVYCGHGRPSQLLLSSCFNMEPRLNLN